MRRTLLLLALLAAPLCLGAGALALAQQKPPPKGAAGVAPGQQPKKPPAQTPGQAPAKQPPAKQPAPKQPPAKK